MSDPEAKKSKTSGSKTPPTTPSKMRPALDADDIPELKRDPDDEDAQLQVGLDETYPASDTPAEVQPHHEDENKKKPPPSTSGGD